MPSEQFSRTVLVMNIAQLIVFQTTVSFQWLSILHCSQFSVGTSLPDFFHLHVGLISLSSWYRYSQRARMTAVLISRFFLDLREVALGEMDGFDEREPPKAPKLRHPPPEDWDLEPGDSDVTVVEQIQSHTIPDGIEAGEIEEVGCLTYGVKRCAHTRFSGTAQSLVRRHS